MKRRAQFYRIGLLSAGLLAVVPVKCNSIFAKSSPVVDDDYEYVTVTGSLVQQRVKKGTQPVSASAVDTMDAEAWRKMTQQFVKGPGKTN